MNRAAELATRLRLIAITEDPTAGDPRCLVAVRATLRGGAPAIQLRAKTLGAAEMLELARQIREETRAAGALFFLNDRLDVALLAGADGVHLGDDDLPLAAARRLAPPPFLIGSSVDTPDEARTAAGAGADYLGVGPVYRTTSKAGVGKPIGPGGAGEAAKAVSIPVVGIGGIGPGRAGAVVRAGAAGVATIRAIMAAADPEAATRALLREITAAATGPQNS